MARAKRSCRSTRRVEFVFGASAEAGVPTIGKLEAIPPGLDRILDGARLVQLNSQALEVRGACAKVGIALPVLRVPRAQPYRSCRALAAVLRLAELIEQVPALVGELQT